MKRIILLLFVCLPCVFAQEKEESEVTNPCEHPIIIKAQTSGLNSLTFREIPQFWFKAFQCKRHAKKTGEKSDFSNLYKQKHRQNFDEARQLSGIGSCCFVITISIMFYSYFGHLAGAN